MDGHSTNNFRLYHSEGMEIAFNKVFSDSKGRFKIVDGQINEEKFSVKNSGVTHRIINHWSASKIIRDNRSNKSKGWRKFSLVDLVWLAQLKEMRKFGMSIKQLQKAYKSTFFSPENSKPWKLYDFWILRSLQKDPVRVIVFDDGHCEYLHLDEIELNNRLGLLPHLSYLQISLNACLKSIAKSHRPPENPWNIVLSKTETKLIDRIRSRDFDEICVELLDGQIAKISTVLKGTEHPEAFINQIENGEYTVKIQNGVPVFYRAKYNERHRT